MMTLERVFRKENGQGRNIKIFFPFNDEGVPVDRRTSALGTEVNIE